MATDRRKPICYNLTLALGNSHSGKAEFDKEIENEAFVGRPQIKVIRLIEESDVVVAEGTVQAKRKDGGTLNVVFCDVFLMDSGKIKKLTSYFMVINP